MISDFGSRSKMPISFPVLLKSIIKTDGGFSNRKQTPELCPTTLYSRIKLKPGCPQWQKTISEEKKTLVDVCLSISKGDVKYKI